MFVGVEVVEEALDFVNQVEGLGLVEVLLEEQHVVQVVFDLRLVPLGSKLDPKSPGDLLVFGVDRLSVVDDRQQFLEEVKVSLFEIRLGVSIVHEHFLVLCNDKSEDFQRALFLFVGLVEHRLAGLFVLLAEPAFTFEEGFLQRGVLRVGVHQGSVIRKVKV